MSGWGLTFKPVSLLRQVANRLFANSDFRWWRTAPRYSARLPLFIGTESHRKAETFDISESGIFILKPNLKNVQNLNELTVNDVIPIHLYLGPELSVSCKARVVRESNQSGRYPAGYGVKFLDLPKAQRRELRRYLTRHSTQLTM